MNNKLLNILFGFLIALFLLGGLFGGYKLYPRLNPCPEIASDTLYVYDTVPHYIPDTIPYYVVKHDSVVYHDTIFKDIDTAAILKDYYAEHHYYRTWKDSLLVVDLKDIISENRPIDNVFTYKILRPQTVIKNEYTSYSYSRYITAGMNFLLKDLSYTGIEVNYISSKWQGGIGYNFGLKGITARVGGTIVIMK